MNDFSRNEFSAQLDRGFSAITALIERLMTELHGKSDTLIRLNTEFQYIRKAVENLEYVVIDGNGQRPLTARVARLEQTLDSIQQNLDHEEAFKQKAKLAVGVAAVGGVMSWISILIEYLRG